MNDLTIDQIGKIEDELAGLRKKLRDHGATALNPTAEWSGLRKKVDVLNKKLKADRTSKEKARKTAEKAAAKAQGAGAS